MSIEDQYFGYFLFSNHYRKEIPALLQQLKGHYRLSVLSGDNEAEKTTLQGLLGPKATLLFHQQPEDKLNYIKNLQLKGASVIMIGDGLNDAGALKQSEVGIAITEQANNFTPSSDAIVEAGQLSRLTRFIALCRRRPKVVAARFKLAAG